MKIVKLSQIPNISSDKSDQIAVQYISGGTPDISEISSEFGQANEAVRMVENYIPGIMRDIAYIAKDRGSGRYGAYATALTRAIKASAVKKILQSQGYQAGIGDNGEVTAIDPTGNKSPEDIEKDILDAKNQLAGKRGAVILINTDNIMNTVRDHYGRIKQQYDSKGVEVQINSNPYELWLKIYHLGLTIAHEAGHAEEDVQQSSTMGSPDSQAQLSGEGPAISREKEFDSKALPYINDSLKNALGLENPEDFVPIESWFEITASSNRLQKTAQYGNPKPSFLFRSPQGSDLSGRFPNSLNDLNNGGYGLLSQQDQSIPIEHRLNRNYMFPLPPNLVQEKDSLEIQLRKYTAEDVVGNPLESIEEMLQMDHDDGIGYFSIEELLGENRPKPLMVPIGKNKDTSVSWIQTAESANSIKNASISKVSYSFIGTFNADTPFGQRFDLKMEDRIYSADDEEESESDRSMEIRKQFRYNPTHTNGIYYSVDNIRGFPYLADNPNNNNLHLHPLERMASDQKSAIDVEGSFSEVLAILSETRDRLINGENLTTRFVMTKDFFGIIGSIFDDKDIRVDIFETDNVIGGQDKLYNVWVSNSTIPPENVEKVEMYLTYGKRDQEADVLLEKLLGDSSVKTEKEKTIKKIVNEIRKICEQYGIKDVYIVGGYARDLEMGNSLSEVKDIDVSGAWSDQCIKVGGLLSERLGIKDAEISQNTRTLHFAYNGVGIDFRGKYTPIEIRDKMRAYGIAVTPLNIDIYNRDFTINMLVYNVFKDKIFDISGCAKKDIENGIVRTFFDPDFVCSENPLIMLRALKFKIRYDFFIDEGLVEAIKKHAPLLFDGRYSEEKLSYERGKIEAEGKEEADNLFYALGLEKILEY